MPRLLVTFLLCELSYITAVRLLLHNFGGSLMHLELWWTLLRVISATALAFIFVRLARSNPAPAASILARCFIATGMFLAPLLTGNMNFPEDDRYLFAATSLVVGVREELAYRGILQRLLTPKLGLVGSLCISNVAFILYHWGVQPFTLHYVLQIFLCGTILGLVYHWSGSLVLVVALHAVYDAIDSFSPYFTPRFPDFVCTVVLSLTLAALVLGRKTPSQSHQG